MLHNLYLKFKKNAAQKEHFRFPSESILSCSLRCKPASLHYSQPDELCGIAARTNERVEEALSAKCAGNGVHLPHSCGALAIKRRRSDTSLVSSSSASCAILTIAIGRQGVTVDVFPLFKVSLCVEVLLLFPMGLKRLT